jgi:hypothetical protein
MSHCVPSSCHYLGAQLFARFGRFGAQKLQDVSVEFGSGGVTGTGVVGEGFEKDPFDFFVELWFDFVQNVPASRPSSAITGSYPTCSHFV